MKFSVDGHILRLRSGKSVEFEFPVLKVLEATGLLVVCLDVPPSGRLNENVFGIAETGERVWQVQAIEHLYQHSPYVAISGEEGLIRLNNWDGTIVIVDPSTGSVIRKDFGK